MFWLCSAGSVSFAEHGVKLYTPFTKISVPPGESIDYNIDVLNNGEEAQKIDIVVTGIPSSWTYSIKSGGWSVQQLAVLPGEKKTLNLKVDVPMRVNKGNHSFRVLARNFDELPLVVNVSEQGTFKTEFTSDQVNMQGHAKASFTFSTKLKNMTGEKQLYSLQANAPRGWEVIFKPNYNQGTAVEVEPNATTNISIDVKPPYNVSAGTYKIPIRAINNATSAENELEVVITGTYEMELTTPRGILSTSLTAGKEKKIEMLVRNTGSSPLSNIRFAASKPQSWEVSFSPDTLRLLEPGASAVVNASIKAYDKAIPGDYVSNITANTPEVSSTAAFRISVKTPLLWGWLGIMIIAVSVGFIYFLFRKYGRR
ncbi:MAG: hypothetical protein JJU28_22855 [Cyclobacteriaceae bacterium]|nr:hypothetical protein [Cyclobacteriaceae bacterium]